jgi:ABC-type branched-subunit amino acid transport system ATPase component
MIEARRIGKRYGGLTVLSDVALSTSRGGILGLIGPNGAGKSTLFNVLTGFVRPDAGQVLLDGQDITRLSPEARNRLGIARTFQIVKPFLRLSVLENAMVGGFSRTAHVAQARERAREALALVGLQARQGDAAHTLTLGDLKRLELARCLATQPKLLLLDEVMGGLNLTEMEQMVRLVARLRERGMTIVVVEHIMDAITALADELVVLAQGRVLAQGKPAAVLKDRRVVDAYLGEPIDAAA